MLFHLNYHYEKMREIIFENQITQYCISRISYIEILSGASENAKKDTRKFLQQFSIVEFDKESVKISINLSMKYRIDAKQSKDFLIAATCIANKIPILTENNKHYNYKGLKILPYRINS